MDEITETVNDVADGSQLIIWLIAIGIVIITAIVSGVITHLLRRVSCDVLASGCF